MSAAFVARLKFRLIGFVPCGASWRYSRFGIIRRLGDWWLPRWYGNGVSLEEQFRAGMDAAYEEQRQDAIRRGEFTKRSSSFERGD